MTTLREIEVSASQDATGDPPAESGDIEERQSKKWYYSLKGDPRWIDASPRYAAHAPHVVIALFGLSVLEVIVGVLWVVQYNEGMTFQGIIQPVIVPIFSFFNTVPSAHLHLYAHVNPPMLAMWFSGILAFCYLVCAIVFVASCTSGTPLKLQKAECWRDFDGNGLDGPTYSIWGAVVGLSWCSLVGYAVHMHMAWVVYRWMESRPRDEHGMIINLNEDPAKKARREALARERWRKMGSEFA